MNEAIKFIFIGIDVLTLVCMIFYLIRGFKKGVIKSVIDVVVKLIYLIFCYCKTSRNKISWFKNQFHNRRSNS
mgnify:CR=1 FL=1